MASIRKIVSTPVKWVSKQIINKTILRFPGGDSHSTVACVYCPEMCRFSCPTAVVSGDDTVTPCNKMGLLYKEEKWPGQASQGAQLWPIYDCTGCGRCAEYCKYEMPVMEKLFKARSENPWEPARALAATLTDEQDRYGDLADELGDTRQAEQRVAKFRAQHSSERVNEPRSFYFLSKNGVQPQTDWDRLLALPLSEVGMKKLAGKTWLLHESVWQSRNLKKFEAVAKWVQLIQDAGAKISLPFAHGIDCIDCGGEGAFAGLFPKQATQMAKESWERDQHRVDGILCMSRRCAAHMSKTLGSGVPVLAVLDLYPEFEGQR